MNNLGGFSFMTIVAYDDPTYMEAVYAALFAQIQTVKLPSGTSINTFQRVAAPPDQVPPANQPALYQIQGPADVGQEKLFGASKWEFTALFLIYVRADSAAANQNPLPSTIANYIIWGIQNALKPIGYPRYFKQTLGGLVEHAWLDGEIIPEVINEQIVISMPVHILAGPSYQP